MVPHALSVKCVGEALSRPELAAFQGPGDATKVEQATETLIAAGLAEAVARCLQEDWSYAAML